MTKDLTRILAAVTVVAIAAMLVVGFYYSGNEKVDHTGLAYDWDQNEAWKYSLAYRVKGSGTVFIDVNSPNNVTKKAQNIDINLVADIVLSRAEIDQSGVILNAVLNEKEFHATLGHQANVIPSFDTPLKFQVNMKKNGLVNKLIMNDEDYKKYGDLVRDIFSLIELPLDSENKAEWNSEEKHMIASYPIVFNVMKKDFLSGFWQVEKSYTKNDQANISGPIVYSFDNKLGLVNQVEGTRQRQFKFNGQSVSGDTTEISLKFEGFVDQPVKQAVAKVNIVEDTLTGEVKRQEMRERSKRTILSGNDIHSIKELLDTANEKDSNEITKISRQVVALLELHPELTGDISQWLLEYDIDDGRFGAVASALTYVGSPIAQEELVRIMDQLSVGEDKYIALMANLAFVKVPTVESEEHFYSLLSYKDNKSVYNKANLSLGIIANNLGEEDQDRKNNIFTLMEKELALSSDSMEDRVYINAIGNIGIPEQVPLIKNYVADEGNLLAVRREAVVALRFVQNEESERLLIDYLADENEGIRVAAAEALTYSKGSEGLVLTYSEQLYSERNISVIKQILKHLSNISSEYPESVDIVDEFISQCGLKSVCDYANQVRSMMI